jgi:putative membrane protein
MTGLKGDATLLPPAPRAEAARTGAAVLRNPEPMTGRLVPHGPAARRRRYARALVPPGIVVVALVLAGWPAWAWQATLLWLPIAAALAEDRYRGLGHATAGGYLVTRHSSVIRRRSALAHRGIIGWNLRQSYFQRRAGLVTVTATTAAGRQRYRIPDVPVVEALRVADHATPGLLAPFLVSAPVAASVLGDDEVGQLLQ